MQETEERQKIALKNISIIDIDYDNAIRNYNPYLGLLANADHIVVAGQSFSLVSEALFTGKNIYLYHPDEPYTHLTKEDYVARLETLNPNAPFPTHTMPPIDMTRQVAEAIIEDYKENTGQLEPAPRPEPAHTVTP